MPIIFGDDVAWLPRQSGSTPARRRILDDGVRLVLVETVDGNTDLIGPEVGHDEVEAIARQLLEMATERCPLPVTMHKLALAYLAARGRKVVLP